MEEKKTQLSEEITPDSAAEPAVEPVSEQEKRLFTQEEVNQIIAKRLDKLRKQAAAENQKQADADRMELEQIRTEIEQSRAELSARETVIQCKEYIQQQGYPFELIDIIDTSDYQLFKEKVDILANIKWQEPRVAPLMGLEGNYYDPTNEMLKPQKHIPRKYGYQGE